MPHELAAAAIVRGAARSTAAEPWKAAVRPPTYLGFRSPSAHRRHFLTTPSTAPPDAHRRRVSSTFLPENLSGREVVDYSWSIGPNSCPSSGPRFLAPAPYPGKKARFNRSATCLQANKTFCDYFSANSSPDSTARPEIGKGVPHLGRLVKASLLILIMLHKMGLLLPPPKADKTKAAVSFVLLALALLGGFVAAKQNKKFEFMLKVCDNTMKAYKLFAEIVNLLSTFFK